MHVLFVACFTEVASLVFQCETYEQLYIHSNITDQEQAISNSDITDQEQAISNLDGAVIETYFESLSFLASAVRHDKHGSFNRLVTAPFKMPNMEDHLAELSKCTTKLSRLADILETKYIHQSFAGVEERLRKTANSLKELARDLDQVPQILAEVRQLKEMAHEQM